jgi:hypothetical protein
MERQQQPHSGVAGNTSSVLASVLRNTSLLSAASSKRMAWRSSAGTAETSVGYEQRRSEIVTAAILQLGSRFALLLFASWQRPSITAVNANVGRQKSMCLRVRDAPTRVGYVHCSAIENGARLLRAQVC